MVIASVFSLRIKTPQKMIFVKMGENPSGITITKNQENVSLMFCICFTTCVSSKSGLGDKMFPSSNLEVQGSCIQKISNPFQLKGKYNG